MGRDFKSACLVQLLLSTKQYEEEADEWSWHNFVADSNDDSFIKQEPQSDQNQGSYYDTVWSVTVSLCRVVHSRRHFPGFASCALMLHNSTRSFHNVMNVQVTTCPPGSFEADGLCSWWVLGKRGRPTPFTAHLDLTTLIIKGNLPAHVTIYRLSQRVNLPKKSWTIPWKTFFFSFSFVLLAQWSQKLVFCPNCPLVWQLNS